MSFVLQLNGLLSVDRSDVNINDFICTVPVDCNKYYNNGNGSVIFSSTNAGVYKVSLIGFSDSSSRIAKNYTLNNTISEQELTITKKELSVSWSDLVTTYNGSIQKSYLTISGFINSDENKINSSNINNYLMIDSECSYYYLNSASGSLTVSFNERNVGEYNLELNKYIVGNNLKLRHKIYI